MQARYSSKNYASGENQSEGWESDPRGWGRFWYLSVLLTLLKHQSIVWIRASKVELFYIYAIFITPGGIKAPRGTRDPHLGFDRRTRSSLRRFFMKCSLYGKLCWHRSYPFVTGRHIHEMYVALLDLLKNRRKGPFQGPRQSYSWNVLSFLTEQIITYPILTLFIISDGLDSDNF